MERQPFLVAYLPPIERANQLHIRQAVTAYAAARGWPPLESENWADANESVDALGGLIDTLSPGDVLLLPSLGVLPERPSEQERIVLALVARGVRVHVLSLSGPVEPHLLALREGWDAARRIERARDEALQQMDDLQAQHERENDAFEAEVVARMAQRFGVKALLARVPEDEPSTIGTFLREAREARGWTQEQVAELVGASKAQISRCEISGRCESLPKLLKLYTPTPETNNTKTKETNGTVA